MRHLRVLNLVCSHRNMRFFSFFFFTKTLHLNTEALRFVCACVAPVWRAYGRRLTLSVLASHGSQDRQDMTCAHVKIK